MNHAYGAAATGVVLFVLALIARPDQPESTARVSRAPAITMNTASLVWLHVRERGRSPLVDVGKLRVASGEAEAADIADNGKFDVK
jgi:hypothetical protein